MKTNSKIFALSSAFALALAGGAAHALGPAGDYVQGHYIDIDDFDQDGFGIAGSFMATPDVRVLGEFNSMDDVDFLRLGAGWVVPMDDQLSFEVGASYLDYDFDDGFGIRGLVRFNATPEFTLTGGLEYVDVGDDDIIIGLGADYRFMPELSAFVSYEIYDDADLDTLRLGARFHF